MTLADILRLELLSISALPDLEHVTQHGWRWRFAHGVTNRANSLTQVEDQAADIETALALFQPLCRAKKIRTAVRVTPLAPDGTEATLLHLGYSERDAAICLVGEPARFALSDTRVVLRPESDAIWREAYARSAKRFDIEEQNILADIHEEIRVPKMFARIEAAGDVIAQGYGVIEAGWLSIHEIGVATGMRRQGLARAICGALAAWGQGMGAGRAWLHVRPDNAAALELYGSMGFQEAYRARYLAEPV